MAQSKARKRKAPSKGSKARSKSAHKGRKPQSKAGRQRPASRRPSSGRSRPRHSRMPLVLIILMVAMLIGGLFLISEYPDDKANIQGGTVLGVVICALVLFNQGQAPRGTTRAPRARPVARRPTLDDTEKPPGPGGPIITPAGDSLLAATPAPLPLNVPMATLAPVAPVKPLTASTPEPLASPISTPSLAARTPAAVGQVRSPVHSRRKVPYPFNVSGGDFANTHILINKDSILQLRTALTADFEPVPIPDYVSVAVSIPRVPVPISEISEISEAPEAPAGMPGANVAPTPALAGVTPVMPVTPGSPVAVAAVAAQPAVAATPVAAVAVAAPAAPGVAVAAPVAVGALPGAPAVATAAVAVATDGAPSPEAEETATEPESDDDFTIDFGDDEEEDMEWG